MSQWATLAQSKEGDWVVFASMAAKRGQKPFRRREDELREVEQISAKEELYAGHAYELS